MTNSEVHRAAREGYERHADSYAQGRPDYPLEIDAWLRESLELRAGVTVLELGAGTGKFTKRLVATGAQVIAVEPVDAMRAKLTAALPSAQALAGTAEAIPVKDASATVVVCAQAFHWFANARALDEIARVLAPKGRLGLIWNMRDARVPWVAQLDSIVNRYEGHAPRYYTGAWRQAFPHARFGALHEAHFTVAHSGSSEDVIVQRVRSTSFIAALAEAEWRKVEQEVRQLIAATPELQGRARVSVPYETAAYWTESRA